MENCKSLQPSPYQSSTCHYATTGTYSCGPQSSATPTCDSFFKDQLCPVPTTQQSHPQHRFNELMQQHGKVEGST